MPEDHSKGLKRFRPVHPRDEARAHVHPHVVEHVGVPTPGTVTSSHRLASVGLAEKLDGREVGSYAAPRG